MHQLRGAREEQAPQKAPRSPSASRHSKEAKKPKKTIEMSFKNNFPKIIQKYNLKMTEDRVQNFRKTMQEIVGVQNGIIPEDSRDLNAPED
tara:strand:+ start:291 stop:563 length:273 start_codon:yes stop_codon:yes gene_type:complete